MKSAVCFIAIAIACLLLSACDPATTIEIKNDTGHAVEITAENRSLRYEAKTVVLQPGDSYQGTIMGWVANPEQLARALRAKVIVFSLRDLVTGRTIEQEAALDLALAHARRDERSGFLWILLLSDLAASLN